MPSGGIQDGCRGIAGDGRPPRQPLQLLHAAAAPGCTTPCAVPVALQTARSCPLPWRGPCVRAGTPSTRRNGPSSNSEETRPTARVRVIGVTWDEATPHVAQAMGQPTQRAALNHIVTHERRPHVHGAGPECLLGPIAPTDAAAAAAPPTIAARQPGPPLPSSSWTGIRLPIIPSPRRALSLAAGYHWEHAACMYCERQGPRGRVRYARARAPVLALRGR